MSSKPYTDREECLALVQGASALRLRVELLANRTDKPEPDDVRQVMDDLIYAADVLEEMAACYEVVL